MPQEERLGVHKVSLQVGMPVQGRVGDDGAMRLPDGTEGVPSPARVGKLVEIRPHGWKLNRVRFGNCPICLDPDPATDEDVPPKSVGGRPMTSTCHRCNNGFGQIESAIALRYRSKAQGTSFFHQDWPGRRRSAGIRLTSVGDQTVIQVDSERADPAIIEMLRSGQVDLELVEPPDTWYRTGLLKHAYLSACLLIGQIPVTDSAAAVRAELVAARDNAEAVRDAPGDHAIRLQTCVAGDVDDRPSGIWFAEAQVGDDWIAGFLLSPFGFVSWPLSDVVPYSTLAVQGWGRSTNQAVSR